MALHPTLSTNEKREAIVDRMRMALNPSRFKYGKIRVKQPERLSRAVSIYPLTPNGKADLPRLRECTKIVKSFVDRVIKHHIELLEEGTVNLMMSSEKVMSRCIRMVNCKPSGGSVLYWTAAEKYQLLTMSCNQFAVCPYCHGRRFDKIFAALQVFPNTLTCDTYEIRCNPQAAAAIFDKAKIRIKNKLKPTKSIFVYRPNYAATADGGDWVYDFMLISAGGTKDLRLGELYGDAILHSDSWTTTRAVFQKQILPVIFRYYPELLMKENDERFIGDLGYLFEATNNKSLISFRGLKES